MRIKSIKLRNNKVLGNLDLDFTDGKGRILDTIIFAGENGAGKSKLLDIIFRFAIYAQPDLDATEKREFLVAFDETEIQMLKNFSPFRQQLQSGLINNEVLFTHDASMGTSYSAILGEWTTKDGKKETTSGGSFTSHGLGNFWRSIFADVEINFNPGNIDSVTALDVDQGWMGGKRSTTNLARQITQLLVDIQTQDALDLNDWIRDNPNKLPDENRVDVRMRRFKSAFTFMFPNKKVKKLINENQKKKLIFDVNGSEVPIENLSSGEKQIVFRGSFLLQDQKKNAGAIVLIDEPEISLHPQWQLKIMGFYKRLFTDNKGLQTSQIFVATHSPFIVHNLSRDNDKVIVLNRNLDGTITATNGGTFFGWTPEIAIQKAFDIEYGNIDKPLVFMEGKTDVKYLFKAAEFFGFRQLLDRFIIDDGHGKGGLSKIWNQADSPLSGIVKQNILLLYDCDTNQPHSERGKVFKRLITHIPENPIKKGIENLFPIETIEKAKKYKNAFFDITKQQQSLRGAEIIEKETTEVNTLEKDNLCNWLCETGTKEDFKFFLNIFEIIKDIGERS